MIAPAGYESTAENGWYLSAVAALERDMNCLVSRAWAGRRLGTSEGTIGGESFAARMRYTRTWTYDAEAGWKIVAAHASVASSD